MLCTVWTWASKSALRMAYFHHFDARACTFSTSESAPTPRCSWHSDILWLPNLLPATAACNLWSLIWRGGSAPSALASLVLDSPEQQNIGKTQCCRPIDITYAILHYYTSSTAQGGGDRWRKFQNRKPIGEVGCCDSRMAERIHWWTERWLELCFFPSCKVTVIRFYVSLPASSSSFLHPPLPRRFWTASSRSQRASPDLVGLAGPHLPALDRSGPRRTSTASSRSQWASPDLSRRESECCGPRRTSPAEIRSTVCLAGPQRLEKMSERSPCRFSLEYQRGRPMENMVGFPRVTFQKGLTYWAQGAMCQACLGHIHAERLRFPD